MSKITREQLPEKFTEHARHFIPPKTVFDNIRLYDPSEQPGYLEKLLQEACDRIDAKDEAIDNALVLLEKAINANRICPICRGSISKDEFVIISVVHAACYRKKGEAKPEPAENLQTTIDMLMDKDEQTRIGINSDDVSHIRPPVQILCRILEAYDTKQKAIDRLTAELAASKEEIESLK